MYAVRTLAVAGALALAAVAAQAQPFVSTNTSVVDGRDQRWQIATINTPGATFSDYVAAFSSNRSANFVTATSSGNFANPRGGVGGVEYSLRTSFTLAAGDQLSVTVACIADNIFSAILINGAPVLGSSAACRGINGPAVSNFTFNANAFIAGLNTVDFRYTGDGTTDGAEIVVVSSRFTPGTPTVPGVVPEPSTYALMATGLAGLVGVSRRRRRNEA